MKKYIFLFAAMLILTACSKDDGRKPVDWSEFSTVGEVTEESTSKEVSEDKTSQTITKSVVQEQTTDVPQQSSQTPLSQNNSNQDNSSSEASPVYSQASPVANVNNALFVDVSGIVRANCNSSNITGGSTFMSGWETMIKTNEDRAYAETAVKLINAYARLNAFKNKVAEPSQEQAAVMADIENGLSANTEIFLNTDNTDVLINDSNFDYNRELSQLESK